MNRKSYLAELRSLLSFMDPDDREDVMADYEDMFDAMGPDREEQLISRLDSPVRQVLLIEKEYRNLPKDRHHRLRQAPKAVREAVEEELADDQLPEEPAEEQLSDDSAYTEPEEITKDRISPEEDELLPEEEPDGAQPEDENADEQIAAEALPEIQTADMNVPEEQLFSESEDQTDFLQTESDGTVSGTDEEITDVPEESLPAEFADEETEEPVQENEDPGLSSEVPEEMPVISEQEPPVESEEDVPEESDEKEDGEAEKAEEPEETEEPAEVREIEEGEDEEEEDEDDGDDEEKTAGPGAGRIIAAVFVTIPMIVLAVFGFLFSIALGAVFAAVGAGLAACGVYTISYVMKAAVTYMPDILLVLGGSIVLFALALLFLWLGIWIAVGGCILTVRIIRAVYRAVLGR